MQKVDSELRKQLMDIIQKEIDDPTVEFLSITRVETTSDLQESKIYFSLLDENKYAQAKHILNSMKGFIRGMLGKKIRLKVLPQLNFIPDESIKYSVEIYQKIEELKSSSKNNGKKNNKKNNRKDI